MAEFCVARRFAYSSTPRSKLHCISKYIALMSNVSAIINADINLLEMDIMLWLNILYIAILINLARFD